jgi:hypothetical protein
VTRPTKKEIEDARTPAGGWTKAQLAEWGVPWPPTKGWKERLLGASGDIKIGDRVPMPPAPKLVVRPSRDADVGGKSIKGAFSNGRGKK